MSTLGIGSAPGNNRSGAIIRLHDFMNIFPPAGDKKSISLFILTGLGNWKFDWENNFLLRPFEM